MGRKSNGLRYSVVNYSEIVQIHNDILKEFGGAQGMNAEGNLAFLVYHIKTYTYSGRPKEQLFSKAAYILQRIVTGHPFTDGNKRTGYNVTQTFLAENGYNLNVEDAEVISFLTSLASEVYPIAYVKKWLRQNAKK